MSIIVQPIFQRPNGYWWAYSQLKPDTIYSLRTKDKAKAQAKYEENVANMRRAIGHDDPADAGMDNPPGEAPIDAETLKIWANMRADDAGRLARELRAARRERDDFRSSLATQCGKTLALREALEQIERYATDDHVKRRARAALKEGGE